MPCLVAGWKCHRIAASLAAWTRLSASLLASFSPDRAWLAVGTDPYIEDDHALLFVPDRICRVMRLDRRVVTDVGRCGLVGFRRHHRLRRKRATRHHHGQCDEAHPATQGAGTIALDHVQSLLQLRLGEPGNQRRSKVHPDAVQQSVRVFRRVLRRLAQHAFVAGQFLVQPQPGQGEPRQRMEPEQGKDKVGQQAPPPVAAAQMREFVLQHQAPFMGIEAAHDIRWQQDPAA